MALRLKQHQLGMTLLEVLVAMTLMVVVSAIAYASLNGLIEAKLHTDQVADHLRQKLLTTQQLNKDIAAMINRPVRGPFGEVMPAIEGGYGAIQFTKNGHSNPFNELRSDLQRVQWYFNDGKLMRRTQNILDVGGIPQWRSRMYLDNIAELNITYTNIVGQQSRSWPIENSQAPLKSIDLRLVFDDATSVQYFLRPIL